MIQQKLPCFHVSDRLKHSRLKMSGITSLKDFNIEIRASSSKLVGKERGKSVECFRNETKSTKISKRLI